MNKAEGKPQELCLTRVKTTVSVGDVSEGVTKALELRSEVLIADRIWAIISI